MTSLQALLEPASREGLIAGLLLIGVPAAIALLYLWRRTIKLQRKYQTIGASFRRNRAIVEATGEGVLELDSSGFVRYANPAAAKHLGYDLEELIGRDYRQFINTEGDASAPTGAVRRMRYTTDIMRGVGALLRRKDGQRRPVEYRIVPITDDGRTVGTALTFRDVSERERLDILLKDMQTTARIGGWEFDLETKRTHWTEAVYAIYDLDPGQSLGTAESRRSFFHPDDLQKLGAATDVSIATGKIVDLQARMTTARGRQIWVRLILRTERRDGKAVRLYGTLQDVTDRVQAELQVRETRDFYELTLDAMPTMVSYTNKDRILTYANKALLDWIGRPREEVVGKRAPDLGLNENGSAAAPHMAAALRGEASTLSHTATRNGRTRDWQMYFIPRVGPEGDVHGYFSILYDLTELKRLEARLLQAQKMEAIGQLTGGIAHDFNNLLGVVLGNLQLLERSVAETPNLARKVHTAMRAAIRGADLTRRLLTFARRQILDPTVVDLNRQLTAFNDLLQRTLGDSIDVRMVKSPDIWHVRVDSGQFENAILNLAINARDAMPQGGRLTVRSQNVVLDAAFCRDHPQIEPGEFVSIAVSDTGSGIEPEVLKRVFEPFFTTKESGKGSGLGLAMVHGFAEQSGGVALIESEKGRGTTVKIFLPRSREAQTEREDTIVTKIAPGGNETILVVEDDADLRETVVTALGQLGYRALAASNAETAMRILSSAEPIDLLFTDVMMPGGILGPTLARRARELRPDIQVLFTTGYVDMSALSGTAGLTAADIIHKPYRNEELALRIRYVLDQEARVA
jgi:PAS domain S-box-containing protein